MAFAINLHGVDPTVIRFLLGIVLAAGITGLSFYLRFLSLDGALTAFLIGTVVFGLGGLVWAIPLIVFFMTSSLLSKLGKSVKARFDLIFEKTSRRDKGQVMANGGVAAVMTLIWFIWPDNRLFVIYLGTLAAVTADTWSTEIGILFKTQPRLITTLAKVPHGTSGGITLPGTLGGLAGSLLIAFTGIWIGRDFFPGQQTGIFVMIIALSGIAGNLLDSLAGVILQAQYRCPTCQQITEKQLHCNEAPTALISGQRWIDNDSVNIICALGGGAMAYLLMLLTIR